MPDIVDAVRTGVDNDRSDAGANGSDAQGEAVSTTTARPALRTGEFVFLIALLMSLVALATDAISPEWERQWSHRSPRSYRCRSERSWDNGSTEPCTC